MNSFLITKVQEGTGAIKVSNKERRKKEKQEATGNTQVPPTNGATAITDKNRRKCRIKGTRISKIRILKYLNTQIIPK